MPRNPNVSMSFDPAEAGAALAHGSDEDQAAFLNALAQELLNVSRSQYAAQLQMTYANRLLTPLAKEVLANISVADVPKA